MSTPASTPKIDEPALRRPDFRGGVPIRLADGQEWTFARPALVFVEADNEDGFEELWNLGPEYAALIARSQAAEAGPDVIRSELALARHLLGLNYDLTLDHRRAILRLSYNEGRTEEQAAMMDAIRQVAFGRAPAPKASAAGPD